MAKPETKDVSSSQEEFLDHFKQRRHRFKSSKLLEFLPPALIGLEIVRLLENCRWLLVLLMMNGRNGLTGRPRNWRADIAERAKHSFLERQAALVDLQELVYGRSSGAVIGDGDSGDGDSSEADSDSDEEFFKVKKPSSTSHQMELSHTQGCSKV